MAKVAPNDAAHPVEVFSIERGRVKRSLLLRSGNVATTFEKLALIGPEVEMGSLGAHFYDSWLRRKRPSTSLLTNPITVVDLFSGCGGLSVGVQEAARATGYQPVHVMAADTNAAALSVFGANFPEAELLPSPIEQFVDGDLADAKTAGERRLSRQLAGLDLVIGGPPCQGHSDLNNHTRRQDPRNNLYVRMARFVEVVRPRLVVIENVPGVMHDKSGAVQRSVKALRSAGYKVDHGVVTATDFGASQNRRRHILLASRDQDVRPSVAELHTLFGAPARSVLDAIGDLGLEPERGNFGTPAKHSSVNARRIKYLFDHDVWELPDSERPDCHRLKPHSYVAVYGRMYADRPAPTITSGFGSTGQGRFVHPNEPRTLTPHEAARLQGFPDWFDFTAATGRRALQEMIGNAVPSRLAYVATASLLR
jgi:DNA (cytosine-5)-methyltransferase 1